MRLPNVLLMLAAVTLTSLAGCGMPHLLYGKRIAGQVVDMDTGQPIAGAHVALLWRSGIIPSGFTGHNSRDICFHAAASTTDAAGRFDIPAWWKWKTYSVYNVEPIVLVYTENYVPLQDLVSTEPVKRPIEHLNERYRLKRFSGTADQRLDMLFWGLANQGCDYGGESQKSIFQMLKAIHTEAQRIARTTQDRDTVHIIARLAATAGIAADPRGRLDEQRLNDFIGRYLQ